MTWWSIVFLEGESGKLEQESLQFKKWLYLHVSWGLGLYDCHEKWKWYCKYLCIFFVI